MVRSPAIPQKRKPVANTRPFRQKEATYTKRFENPKNQPKKIPPPIKMGLFLSILSFKEWLINLCFSSATFPMRLASSCCGLLIEILFMLILHHANLLKTSIYYIIIPILNQSKVNSLRYCNKKLNGQ